MSGRADAARRDLERVPEELRERPQWVAWCWEERDGRRTKVPYDPVTGRRASTTDLLTWRPFETVMGALESGGYDGAGFVFSSGDPYAGVDLDGCRDTETGEVEHWAREVVGSLDGYAEVSPSGSGVHVIVRGEAPNKRRGAVEAYSTKRFFTVTGRSL